MLKMNASLHDWGTDTFIPTLRAEIKRLPAGELPLNEAVSQGGYVDDNDLEITVFRVDDDVSSIQVRLGVFFTEIVICCGCGDDPMTTNAYCEMQLSIDKRTAASRFSVIRD
jgi:hypothetical protein